VPTPPPAAAPPQPEPEPEPKPEPEPIRSYAPAPSAARDRDRDAAADDESRRPSTSKKRRRRTVGIVAALAIAGVGAVYLYSGSSSDNAASGTPAGATMTNGAGEGAAGAVGASAASKSPSPTAVANIILPTTVDGLVQMTNTTGKNVVTAMKKANSGSADLANAQVAAFEKSGSSSFLADLTLVQLSKAPDFQTVYQGAGPDAALKSLGASSFSDSETVTTKIPGSAMACGLSTAGGVILRKCIWVDASEYGLFAGVKTLSNGDASAFAEAIEAASEGS
jgi:hypothetical protein